jgi:hypothetical protein
MVVVISMIVDVFLALMLSRLNVLALLYNSALHCALVLVLVSVPAGGRGNLLC